MGARGGLGGTDLAGVVEILVDDGLDVSVVALERVRDHRAVFKASDHGHHLDLLRRHGSPAEGHLDCPGLAVAAPSEDVKVGESEASRCHPEKVEADCGGWNGEWRLRGRWAVVRSRGSSGPWSVVARRL